jgi:hypothetical protein
MSGAGTRSADSTKAVRVAKNADPEEAAVGLRKLILEGARGFDPKALKVRTVDELAGVPLLDLMDRRVEADDRERVRAFYGKPLDPKITPLVRTLQAVAVGFETKGSCEGHLDRGYHHYPMVTIRIGGPLGKGAAEAFVEGFNHSSDVQWMLRSGKVLGGDCAIVRPEATSIFQISQGEFDGLQTSAGKFALFLYDRYVADGKARRELSRIRKRLALEDARRGMGGE